MVRVLQRDIIVGLRCLILGQEATKIIIGHKCKFGDYVHIASGEKVLIGNNCLLASKIFISDISHGNYSDSTLSSTPDVPPDERPIFQDLYRLVIMYGLAKMYVFYRGLV